MATATYPPPPLYYRLYKYYLEDSEYPPEPPPPIEGTCICTMALVIFKVVYP